MTACRRHDASSSTGDSESGRSMYRERSSEIAGELAMHFEGAANYLQAARYLRRLPTTPFAVRSSGNGRASRRGLELLAKLPDTVERARQELWLQITWYPIAIEGYAAPDVGNAYTKARTPVTACDTSEISQGFRGCGSSMR